MLVKTFLCTGNMSDESVTASTSSSDSESGALVSSTTTEHASPDSTLADESVEDVTTEANTSDGLSTTGTDSVSETPEVAQEDISQHVIAEHDAKWYEHALTKERKRVRAYRKALRYDLANDDMYAPSVAWCKEMIGYCKQHLKCRRSSKRKRNQKLNSTDVPSTADPIKKAKNSTVLNFHRHVKEILQNVHNDYEHSLYETDPGTDSSVLCNKSTLAAAYTVHREELLQWCAKRNLTADREMEVGKNAFLQLYDNDEVTAAFMAELPHVVDSMRKCKQEWEVLGAKKCRGLCEAAMRADPSAGVQNPSK